METNAKITAGETDTINMTTIQNRNSCRRSPFRKAFQFLLAVFLCLVVTDFVTSSSFFVDAYRIGDTIDASLSTRSSKNVGMMIANQPLFGVTKTVRLDRLPERFSISFEEGLYTIPYADSINTETLIVTFVYSKSGAGKIHSVTSKAVPFSGKSDPSKKMEVVYEWVEEAAVDLEAGSIIMFLGVFVVSIVFLLQLCTIEQPDDYDDDHQDSYYKGQ